jgi:hypothetical protein
MTSIVRKPRVDAFQKALVFIVFFANGKGQGMFQGKRAA